MMQDSTISRRIFILAGGSIIMSPESSEAGIAPILLNPIDVKGEWHAPSPSAALVVGRMREACCSGFRLLSDRQPRKLVVEARSSGPPAVWLHQDQKETAIIFVDVGERAWTQLAYQFGHELGHVISNSWDSQAKPTAPCQWVEELVVESFSLRGLAILATTWEENPPFPGDANYGKDISRYREDAISQYHELASSQGIDDSKSWFDRNRQALEDFVGLSDYAKAAVSLLLPALMKNPLLLEDVGALNLWPERTALPLDEYLIRWRLSCKRLGSAGLLPEFIRKQFLQLG